ncbi:MAG TPA: hypothetical protein VN953_05530 [Gemmatimonadales bacterium]|nr:hypothetical protein [Gemmatimonadales bacterium]
MTELKGTGGRTISQRQDLYAELPKRTGIRVNLFDGWKQTASQEPIPSIFSARLATSWTRMGSFAERGWRHLPPLFFALKDALLVQELQT